MLTTKMHTLYVLILMVTAHSFSSSVHSLASKCPADITQLAFTSGLKTDCTQLAIRSPCKQIFNKYRTNDGSCNNVDNKGSTFAEIDRLLPPYYEDGSNSPRQHGKSGQSLPSARRLVVDILTSEDVSDGNTIALFQWGQWTSHDMLSTAVHPADIRCCGENGEPLSSASHPDCFPIEVPPNDTVFPGTCLNFFRNPAANCSDNRTIKPRLYTNDVTTFIDSSNVYGSDDETAKSVRVPGSILLRTTAGAFLPEDSAGCPNQNRSTAYCFLAGDHRSNQHTYLTAIHTLWLREHNRIAIILKLLKRTASNEEIFQITRKIVNGMNQAITYNEYLPALLGDDAKRWKLISRSGRSVYNPKLNPSLVEEFTAAAFRLGHSQSPSKFPIGNQLVPLRYLYGSSGLVFDHFEDIIAAMAGQSPIFSVGSQAVDKYFTEELTNYLFFQPLTGRADDLASRNINRGRDHGLPPYVKVREFCCLPPVTGFNDTEALGPDGYELAEYYNSLEDLDLYTGMMHEPIDKGLAGPTIRCIVGLQFYRLKYGDKHFFDNNALSLFTDAQLASIRRVTLAHIVCHHTDLESVQRNAFKFPSSTNEEIDCSQLKENGLDLTLFV